MLLRRISYRLAFQFMAFVFVLLLINGLLFLAVDYSNARRQLEVRMLHAANGLTLLVEPRQGEVGLQIPARLRELVRIVDPEGNVLYAGGVFADTPFSAQKGFARATLQGEQFFVLTNPIRKGENIIGYVQIADIERQRPGELPGRALMYLFVSLIITVFTFFAGLFFARRSLQPAEEAMQRLEQFTQDASHELRTPIATVNSALDLAMETGKYPEKVASAKKELKRLSGLVDRLLELAQLDRSQLLASPIDFSLLAAESVAALRPLAAERKVEITEQIKPAVRVQADAVMARQVMDNLLLNAIKFSPAEGGTVSVTLTDKYFIVKDQGIGIAPEDQQRIFHRFYQADVSRSKEGFGLGLSLAKRIADLHGWSITVASTPGKGATFMVRFSAAAKRKQP